MHKYLFILSILLSATTGFSQSNYCIPDRFSEGYYFDSTQVQVDHNVVYGVSKNYFTNVKDTLKMDVFYPKPAEDNLTKRPFIMLIHGGAFLAGARSDMYYQCMEYARRGFVTATMEYRLGWNCAATDFFNICLICSAQNVDFMTATYCAAQDGHAAMRYIVAHANDYGIDPDYLIIGGESAGSITAMHTIYWDQTEANDFAPWAEAAVGSLDTTGNSYTNTFSVKAIIDNCGAVSKDSIVLNNTDIPVVSFHDEDDCIVPKGYGQVISCFCNPFYWVAGSEVIYNKITQAGGCAEYHQVPLSVNHCGYPTYELVPKASCFIKRLMCGDCTSSWDNDPTLPIACDSLVMAIVPPAQSSFQLFPNPASNVVEIQLSASMKVDEVMITDLLGSVIYEGTWGNGLDTRERIDTRSFPNGLYILNLINANAVIAKEKLVISR